MIGYDPRVGEMNGCVAPKAMFIRGYPMSLWALFHYSLPARSLPIGSLVCLMVIASSSLHAFFVPDKNTGFLAGRLSEHGDGLVNGSAMQTFQRFIVFMRSARSNQKKSS